MGSESSGAESVGLRALPLTHSHPWFLVHGSLFSLLLKESVDEADVSLSDHVSAFSGPPVT